VGSSVVIRDSSTYCGSSQDPSSAIVNIAAGCPQRIILEGISGPADSHPRIVQVYGGYDVGAHIAERSYAAQFIKVSVDSNVEPGAGSVPAPLVPYMNPFESSVFPMGQQPGLPVAGQPSQSQFLYYLPAGVAGFTALLTISVNPNVAGSGAYRTSATYLLSMTTNYSNQTGLVTDYLSWSLLLQPAATYQAYAVPSIASITFDGAAPVVNPPVAGVCNAQLQCAAPVESALPQNWTSRTSTRGGTFTVTWDSNVPVPVSEARISIQPIHMIT